METYEVLERALGLIEDERNWCQGDFHGPGGHRMRHLWFGRLCFVIAWPPWRCGVAWDDGSWEAALKEAGPGDAIEVPSRYLRSEP